MLKTGIIGTAVGALCCATPILALLLSAVGLSWASGWLDYVLLPAFAAFAAVTMIALIRRMRA